MTNGFRDHKLKDKQKECKHVKAVQPVFGDWYCPECKLKRKRYKKTKKKT